MMNRIELKAMLHQYKSLNSKTNLQNFKRQDISQDKENI